MQILGRRAHPAPWQADQASTRAEQFLRRCGRRALAPEALAALHGAGAALSSAEWEEVRHLAQVNGMEPLVFKHTAKADLLALPPPRVVAELKAAYCATLLGNRRFQRALSGILAACATEGVEVIPFKGVALAERYYQEPALRPVRDLDLLVRRPDAARCAQALRQAGYRPVPGYGSLLDADVLRYFVLQYTRERGPTIELHLRLCRQRPYAAGLSVTRVWGRAQVIELWGQPARYLDPGDELRYLSYHYAAQHRDKRLIWLVDIVELVSTLPPAWDWSRFVDDTIACGLATPVVVTLVHARDLLDLRLPPTVAERLATAALTRRERVSWRQSQLQFAHPIRLGRHLLMLQDARERWTLLRVIGANRLRTARWRLGRMAARTRGWLAAHTSDHV